jgi:2-polyprenyl-6-methoxyphenol hydroxylase-like FAD-dependent oxidoreductase
MPYRTPMGKRRHIAIAGCGVAGLAAGTFLARAGHRVRAFDRQRAPAPIGSGLILQPVGLAVLEALGQERAITALGARIDRLFGRVLPSGRVVLDVRYAALKQGGTGLSVHRAALFHLLFEGARSAGVEFEFGRKVTHHDTEPDGRARLGFDEGGGGTFDLVVDALGARSPLAPERGRALPFGALWANVPWPDVSGFDPNALEQRYVHADKMVGVLPIGRLPAAPQRLAAFFWSLRAEGEASWRATPLGTWKEEVLGVWPQVAPLLSRLNAHSDLVFARYAHRTLGSPVAAGIAHIGDSYHAASPQLGQGANMALLDALALACALEQARDVHGALALHARFRHWHVRLYQLASALFTPAYQSDSRWLPFVRDRIAGPISRFGPFPRVLAALVAGKIGWPLARLERGTEADGDPAVVTQHLVGVR